MRKLGLIGLALAVPGGVAATDAAQAADAARSKAAIDCHAKDAPYKNYYCLDAYLGEGFFERMINYYKLEWGHEGPPADPKAPPARRAAIHASRVWTSAAVMRRPSLVRRHTTSAAVSAHSPFIRYATSRTERSAPKFRPRSEADRTPLSTSHARVP